MNAERRVDCFPLDAVQPVTDPHAGTSARGSVVVKEFRMALPSTIKGGEQLQLADMRRRVKAIFVGSAGNLVEWYDFYTYSAFALYFASSFFPGNDPVVQQLNAAVLFALGFIMRPIGGWLFGYLADHYGRRKSLMLSVLLMCFGSLMIAVTPTLSPSAAQRRYCSASRV